MLPEFDEQMRIHNEHGVMLRLCLHLLLFYRETDESQPKRQAVVEILEEHAALTGNSYRWTQNPQTGKWKKLKSGMTSYIQPREWFLGEPYKKDFRYIIYHAGELASDASDVEVFIKSGSPGAKSYLFIQLQFPLDQFDGHQEGLPQLAQKWSARLQPEHGYGGLRLADSHGYEDSYGAQYGYMISQRLPGLDVGQPITHSNDLVTGIKGADWLTILSDSYVNTLGGKESIRHSMGDLPVLPYTGGLLLQAGPIPLAGDVQRGHDMSSYKKIAQLVEPIRCKDHQGGYYGSGHDFGEAAYRAWLARFSPQPE